MSTRWDWAWSRIIERRDLAQRRARIHGRRALWWQRAATPLAFVTAILAALSGLSIVSDSHRLAVGFGIATAVVAAINLALQPGETAKSHRAAAIGYERLARDIDDFWTFEGGEGVLAPADAERVRKRLKAFDAQLEGIEQSHPPPTLAETESRHGRTREGTLATDKRSYVSGESITVTFDHSPYDAKDWVGIYLVGENPNDNTKFWQYVGGGRSASEAVDSGSLLFSAEAPWDDSTGSFETLWPPTPGEYTATLFEANSYAQLAQARFTIVAQASPT
jgi:hypothetical protein